MKIVGPNRQGVQSLGAHSVGNTGYEGDAVLAETLGSVGQTLGTEISRLKTNRELQKASLNAADAQNQFDEMYSGREFFDIGELPSEVLSPEIEADPQGRVAAALVKPKLYEYHMKDVIGNISQSIGLPSARDEWSNQAQGRYEQNYTDLAVKSAGELQRQYLADQMVDYREAKEAGNWSRASGIVDGMYATEKEKEFYRTEVSQGFEKEVYLNAMSETDIEAIDEAIGYLSQKEEDYIAKGGVLNERDRLTFLNSLNSKKKAIYDGANAINKADKERLLYDIATERKNSSEGKRSSPEALSELYERALAMNIATEGELTREILELEDDVNLSLRINDMLVNPVGYRTAFAQAAPKLMYPDDERRANKMRIGLETANQAMFQKELDDSMQAWMDSGWFTEQGGGGPLTPINLGDPESINARYAQYKGAQQHFGWEGQGMMSKEEAEAISLQLNQLSIEDQMKAMANVNAAIEGNSLGFFQQLGTDGDAGSMSMAGAAFTEGYLQNAKWILQGREYLNKNPDTIRETKLLEDLRLRITSDFPNLWSENPDYQKVVYESIQAAYIGKSIAGGDFNYDSDRYEEALLIGTGGTFKHGGKVYSSPGYGMPQGTMETWIEDTDWRYIEETSGKPLVTSLSGPILGSTENFWEDFQDGKYRLVPTGEDTEFGITDSAGNRIQGSNGNYTIKYDPASLKTRDVPRETGKYPRNAFFNRPKPAVSSTPPSQPGFLRGRANN